MNKIQKETIRYLRGEGLGYKAIATRMGVTDNAVKSYCKRNGLNGVATKNADVICRQCGKLMEKPPGTERKKFCSAVCRSKWWSHHPYLYKMKEEGEKACEQCGKNFNSFYSKNRKYCCHPCYIIARFGKWKHDPIEKVEGGRL